MLASGDYCLLVGFVEKWSEKQDPTPLARLSQAEAFLQLKLMDKAWVRLKALTEEGVCGVQPHLLSARMFIERGWSAKARKVVLEGLERAPEHAGLLALLEAAQRDAPAPDAARADDPAAGVDELMPLAEHFMAQGAFVRARSLLERVRRAEPEHRRALELLQAIDGRFGVELSLSEIVERHGPVIPTLADLSDDADHTESASADAHPHAFERDDVDPRFPSLFRGLAGPAEEATLGGGADDTEVTAVSSLAEMRALIDGAEVTDGGEDTQIMRVVHRSGSAGGLEPATGAVHHSTPEPDASFNLADFRREMGMTPQSIDRSFDDQSPEDEDESVIVRIGAQRADDEPPEPTPAEPPPPRAEPADAAGADTEIHAHTATRAPEPKVASRNLLRDAEAEARAARAQGTSEDDAWAADASEGNHSAPRAVEPAPKPPPKPAPPRPPPPAADDDGDLDLNPMQAWPAWVAILVLLFAVAFVTFTAFVVLMLVT